MTLELANKMFLLGHMLDAAELYEQTIQRSPTCWAAYLSGARAYDNIGQRTDAIRMLLAGLTHPRLPTNHAAILWSEVGRLAAELDKNLEALRAYNVAIYLAGTDPDIYARRAEVLAKLNKPDEAIEDCANVVQLAPATGYDLSEVYLFRGSLLLELGEKARTLTEQAAYLEQAESDFGQAIFLLVHRHSLVQAARAYLKRAQIYQMRRDLASAERDRREARKLAPALSL